MENRTILKIFNTTSSFVGSNNWHVTGKSLQSIVKTGTVGDIPINILVSGDSTRIEKELGTRMVAKYGEIKFPVLKEFVKECRMMKCNIPRNLGAVLDEWNPLWPDMKSTRTYNDAISFFTAKRRKEAHEEIAIMLECGEKVGIRDKMFLGFGGVLGYAWMNDFMPNDDDIDICFLPIEQQQKEEYLKLCKSSGLCEHRMRGPVGINGGWTWFSIGRKSSHNGVGVKSCNWFWFMHNGYWWHSKSVKWINRESLHKGNITAKGIPCSVFNGELREVEFGGNRINVPLNIGKCLDWWYPEWIFRKQCSSAPSAVLVIKKQEDKKTWYIERNN